MIDTSSAIRNITVIVVAALLLGAGSVASASDGDFRYWSEASFLVPIRDDWQFKFEHKFDFEDEARRLGYQEHDYGFVYSGLADGLKMSAVLKVVHAKTGDREDWIREIRPHFNVSLRSKLLGLDLSNRSRFEYRDVEDKDAAWRFRHKVRLVSPVTFTSWQVKPYIADELFYKFDSRRFSGQRFYAGFYVPLAETIRLELFYLWYLYDDDHWHDTNVLGSHLRFTF